MFVAVPLFIGWHYRPQAEEAPALVGPSVVVFASRPGVAATVNATLSIGYRHDKHKSELQLMVVATSKISGSIQLTVELSDFPSGTTVSGADVAPVKPPAASSALGVLPVAAEPYPRGYADYAFQVTLSQPSDASAAMKPITIVAPRPIGEASVGDQLRVAFPVLRGEGPGANPAVGYKVADLFSGAASLLGSRLGYPMTLQAGTSTFSGAAQPLSGYQVLAGDAPTLLGATTWSWDGINDATVLAADVHAQDIDQLKVFYSGLALGLAFAAVITLLLELIPAESGAGSEGKKDQDGGAGGGDTGAGQEPATSAPAG